MKDFFQRFLIPTPLGALPPTANAEQFLAQERERLLTAMLRILFILGQLVFLAMVPFSLRNERMAGLILYAGLDVILGIVTFNRRLPFGLRASFLLGILYLLSLEDMARAGWASDGRVILYAFVLLTFILFGTRVGVAALGLATLSLVGLGAWLNNAPAEIYMAGDIALVSILTFAVLAGFILMGLNVLMQTTFVAWARERATAQLAAQKQTQLTARLEEIEQLHQQLGQWNETLEQTVQARTIELQMAVQAAEAANLAKSQFLATMSHELRTPLAVIIGYGEMLHEVLQTQLPRHGQKAERVLTAANHLLNLINDLLDYSNLEANRLELNAQTFEISPLIEQMVAAFRPALSQNSNLLELNLAPDLGAMTTDPTRLRQALLNLLYNATKFTHHGVITLTVQRAPASTKTTPENADPDWLTFRVADTGIGLTDAQLVNLFQPFRQGDASNTRKYGGTGLGLVVSRRLCRMMGGDITVASTPEIGSSFTIHLPARMPTTSAPLVTHALPHPTPAQVAQGVILVIDDDEAVRELLALTLSEAGFIVETARDGTEGLEKALLLHPAAITLDVLMPEMDGWEFLKQLKAQAALQNTPVICITVLEHQEQGRHLGATDYLLKPLDRQGLVKTLSKYRSPINPVARKLLVVDDDAQVREVMYDLLTAAGWQVTLAASGQAALAQMAVETPNLIVLDLMMPEMDGFQFVTQLRQTPNWRSIPVVVVTALALTREEQERLNGFVTFVLQKTDLAQSTTQLVQNIQVALAQPTAPFSTLST